MRRKTIKLAAAAAVAAAMATAGAGAANAAVTTSKEKASIKVGADALLMEYPKEDLKWTSSNPKVVTVRSELNTPTVKAAILTAKGTGTCTVTAKSAHYKFVYTYTAKKDVAAEKAAEAARKATTYGQPATAQSPYDKIISSLSAAEKTRLNKILALKKTYPEGRRLTNEFRYEWNGGIWRAGYGCAGFAMMASDKAYPASAKARRVPVTSSIDTGDIVFLYGNAHVAIVLGEKDGKIALAEGNYNSAMRWGRVEDRKEISMLVKR